MIEKNTVTHPKVSNIRKCGQDCKEYSKSPKCIKYHVVGSRLKRTL